MGFPSLAALVTGLLILSSVHSMTRHRLPFIPRMALLVFLGIAFWQTADFKSASASLWGGVCALLAVTCAWRDIGGLYAGKTGLRWLIASGILTALTCWACPGAGILLALALGGFGLFQSLLHEREESGAPFGRLSRRTIARRWLRRWGRGWLLPLLALQALWLIPTHQIPLIPPDSLNSFSGKTLGISPSVFFPDPSDRHAEPSPAFGYFTTFHLEFAVLFRPPPEGTPFWPELPARLARGVTLPLIAALPVIGILGTGSALPARFLYRTLRPENEERLLFLLTSAALIAATFSHPTAAHIVANGTIPFTLGWMILRDWLSSRPRTTHILWLTTLFWLFLVVASLL